MYNQIYTDNSKNDDIFPYIVLAEFENKDIGTNFHQKYVLLRLRVQNRRKKWNFLLNFRTMRKLSDLYSGIFQNYLLFNHMDVHVVWTSSETLQN